MLLLVIILIIITDAFFSAFPIVFSAHGFNLPQIGASFTGLGIGVLVGTATTPYWAGRYRREAERLGHQPAPEFHLQKGIIGGIVAPLGLLWFAFTTYPSVHWIVPIVRVFHCIVVNAESRHPDRKRPVWHRPNLDIQLHLFV